MANEKDRSHYHLVDRKAKTESFKRSNHNDFATTEELKKRKFSGWRENKILCHYEMWVDGEIVRVVTFTLAAIDPQAMEKAFADFFQLGD